MLKRWACRNAPTDGELLRRSCRVGQSRWFSVDWFMEKPRPDAPENELAPTYEHTFQPLHATKLSVHKEAFGIRFHTSDEGAVDAACTHHGASVKVHSVEKLLMPFWLFRTACGGTFRGELRVVDHRSVGGGNAKRWLSLPTYDFSYPMDDYFVFNQVSGSYLLPNPTIEKCMCGSHVPSMLVQRYELLEELEAMDVKAKLIPFAMSTATGTKIIEARHTRALVMQFVQKELRKYYGTIHESSLNMLGIRVDAVSVRPVFLPLYKMEVSTRFHSTVVPLYVCGATGNTAGPVLRWSRRASLISASTAAMATLLVASPLLGPEVGLAAAASSCFVATAAQQFLARLRFLRQQARDMAELRTNGLLNFSSDQTGYKWTVEDEERAEFEYREELRRRARKKSEFEERVKEEYARDDARSRGVHFDPKNRRRNDLRDVDPLGFYRVLGLVGKETTATAKDIQQGFREVSKKHHPDLNVGNEEEAKKIMQAILEAYSILRDPLQKKQYDSGKMTKAED